MDEKIVRRKKKSKKKTKKWQVAAVVILSLLLVGLVGSYAVFNSYFSLIKKAPDAGEMTLEERLSANADDPVPTPMPLAPGEVTPPPAATPDPGVTAEKEKEIYNLLFMGIDNREDAYTRRNDATLMVTVNKRDKKITATSFIRDGRIWMPGWGYQKLNVANVYGGPQLVIDTIEYNYGVKADNYLMINFFAFQEVVDAMGGVRVQLTDDEVNHINGHVPDSPPLTYTADGYYNLDGAQALMFCRDRYVGSDIERTARQRRMLGAALEKVKTLSLSEISNVAKIGLNHTISDIDQSTFLSLVALAPSLKSYTFEHGAIPIDGTWQFENIGGGSYITFDLDANREYLQKIFYGLE